MVLNGYGQIAHDEWLRSEAVRSELRLDAFVVMPNHIHGIVFLDGQKGDLPVAPTPVNGPRARSLSSFIGGYKSTVTRCVNRRKPVGATGRSPAVGAVQTIWQRNYHDHIVRNDGELTKIRQYIMDNPRHWETDDHHPSQDKRDI